MNQHLAWYVARATGIVAWILLSIAVILGLFFATRMGRGRVTPKWLLDLHQFSGGLSVVFTALHVGSLVADNYVSFGWVEVLVPFSSHWRTGGVSLGVVATYLLVAVELSSLWMRHLPRIWWKRVHLASYWLFWMATFHFLMAGTDVSNPISRVVLVVAIAWVVFLSLIRILSQSKSKQPVKGKVSARG